MPPLIALHQGTSNIYKAASRLATPPPTHLKVQAPRLWLVVAVQLPLQARPLADALVVGPGWVRYQHHLAGWVEARQELKPNLAAGSEKAGKVKGGREATAACPTSATLR